MLRLRSVAGAVAVVTLVVLGMVSGGPSGSVTAASAAATAGCGKAPTLTSGTQTIQSGGQNRSYILRVPDNYDPNRPYRLIFGFHWNGGTANDVDSGGTSGYPWSYYGLRALSNNSAIFVAPQGLNAGWANTGGQDLTFVDDMVRHDRERPVRRHHAALRHGLQLRRRHELLHRVQPGDRSSGRSRSTPVASSAGAAAARSRSPTSASTACGTTCSTSRRAARCVTGSCGTTAARRRTRRSRRRAA